MMDGLGLKRRIDTITLWIDQRNLSLGLMIGAVTILWIVANTYFNDFSTVSDRVIKQTGKGLGSTALWCAAVAFSYYAWRETYVYGRKKSPFVKQHQAFFSFGMVVLRRLHIWFGVLAVAFVIDHGYLLWIIRSKGALDMPIQTGLLVAVCLFVLASLGTLIRIYPAAINFRLAHRFFAFLVFLGYLIHMAVIR